MDFKHTNLSLSRPIGDYTKIQLLAGSIIRNSKWQLRKINKDKHYLNVGCGPNLDDRFINLDYQWRPGMDLCWDITKGIPLKSNSITGIYTEHCLEHITFEQTQAVLLEFHRLLKPGGIARIIVPDAELYIDLYTRSKNGEDVSFPYVADNKVNKGFSPIMPVNRVFRGHEHLYAYDFDCLSLMLKQTGFERTSKESYRKGNDEILLIDSETRKIESVYLEAVKSA